MLETVQMCPWMQTILNDQKEKVFCYIEKRFLYICKQVRWNVTDTFQDNAALSNVNTVVKPAKTTLFKYLGWCVALHLGVSGVSILLVSACDSAVHVLSFSRVQLCHTLKAHRSDRNLLSNVTEHLVPPN